MCVHTLFGSRICTHEVRCSESCSVQDDANDHNVHSVYLQEHGGTINSVAPQTKCVDDNQFVYNSCMMAAIRRRQVI